MKIPNLAVIDFETEMVGEYEGHPRIVQVGVVLFEDGRRVNGAQWNVYNGRLLGGDRPGKLQFDEGERRDILNSMTWEQVGPLVERFVPKGYTPAAWPSTFEKWVYEAENARFQLPDRLPRRWLCLMSGVQTCAALLNLQYQSASLESLWTLFGLGTLDKQHRGVRDAEDEAHLYFHALRQVGG